jgi:hypothetical protein
VLPCVTRVTLWRLALCSWGVFMLLALCGALSYTLGSLVAMGLGFGLAVVCVQCKLHAEDGAEPGDVASHSGGYQVESSHLVSGQVFLLGPDGWDHRGLPRALLK